MNFPRPSFLRFFCRPLLTLLASALCVTAVYAAEATKTPSIVFIGNSFLYAAGSPVRIYRAHTVTDLNNEGIGGVPALFKTFVNEAGRDYAVSLETGGGKSFDWHIANKVGVLSQPWDYVVMHGYSTLDSKKPGDPTNLIKTAKELAEILHAKNPAMDIRLMSTWSRADQTYKETGAWYGKPIEQMALDIRAAYDKAAASTPAIRGVIPVGEAWNRAIKSGIADPNPYDGIEFDKVSLWTTDYYHGSTYGYYLEALIIFGDLTGLDPRSLAKDERAAFELGMSAAQAVAFQKVAAEELLAAKGRKELQTFTPVKLAK